LLAPGGISVSYGVGAGAMAAVSSLRIHAFYDTSTTVIDPLPDIVSTAKRKDERRCLQVLHHPFTC
jgi:hypothetical protein